MLSINTNLSSLIAQDSIKTSTNKLNLAIERMTTGFKINHAKDNAANYGISTQMQTKLYAYDVAADNVAMGMDLVTTASDTISMMHEHATRLRDLATQARNGTYGTSSIDAINAEVGAIISEIERLYNTAEYNKVSLFNRKAFELPPEHQALCEDVKAKEEYGGFIDDPKTYEDSYVDGLTSVTGAISGAGLQANEEYKVATKEDLQALATFVNGGGDTTNMTFILAGDIDLSSISNWTPIGTSSYRFKGTFDGNGHKIKNLTINNPTADYQGLFGCSESGSAIQNVGIEGASVTGKMYVGALVGLANGTITNSYATGDVSGQGNVGGLVGVAYGTITNSYATGDVSGTGNTVGGLAGGFYSTITNSYATGDVSGNTEVGGLAGSAYDITNSYATGDVSGQSHVGGLAGNADDSITNSYATGDVSGNERVGGLVGYRAEGEYSISNSYSTGNIKGVDNVGGLVGYWNTVSYRPTTIDIQNSASYSNVTGNTNVTSIANINSSGQISFSLSNVKCLEQEGINLMNTTTAYDLTSVLENISFVELKNVTTSLQVGINSDESCRLSFDTNFELDLDGLSGDITSDETLNSIDEFLKMLNEKSTMLGAVENRLNSAVESIEVNMNNLTSSLSTIRDADIAEVSSEYIRQQILQQASATLLATANQSPSIALQLI